VRAAHLFWKRSSLAIGYLCAITWQTGVAGTAFVAGTLIQSIFVLNISTYVPHPYHGTLFTIAFVILALVFNTFLARRLPVVEGVFVFMHVLGILIFIPLWIMAPRREGGAPLVDFANMNGWATSGIATMIATVGPSAALTGFDCSVHMGMSPSAHFLTLLMPCSRRSHQLLSHGTDHPPCWIHHQCPAWIFFHHGHVRKPSHQTAWTCTNMPRIYTIGPLPAFVSNPDSTGYLILDLFYSATGSKGGATFMAMVIVICEIASCIASLAAASRQVWAFSRNNGFPFSRFFAPVRVLYFCALHQLTSADTS
jgi:amino acid transporter